jgi:hypothetical protein
MYRNIISSTPDSESLGATTIGYGIILKFLGELGMEMIRAPT